MTKLTLLTITSLSVMLAGCQKAKMSSSQPAPSASAQSPTPPQQPPGGPIPPPAGYPPLPPRFPEPEPVDVVVNPPPLTPPPIIPPPRIPEPDPRDPTVTPPPIRPSPPITTTTPPPGVSTPPVLTPVENNPPVNPPPVVDRPPVRPPTTTRPPITQPPVDNPPVVNRPPVTPPPTTTRTNPPVTQPPVNQPPVVDRPPVTPPTTQVPPPHNVVPTPRPVMNEPPVVQTQVPPPYNVVPTPRPPCPTCGGTAEVPPKVVVQQPARPITPTPKQFLTKDAPSNDKPSNIPVPSPAPEERPTVQLPENPPVPATKPVEYASIEGQCTIEPVTMAQKSQLDVLFVVDTSGSIRKGPKGSEEGGELVKIAGQMGAFVDKLPAGTDINIGVILAHGPKSPHYGRLFAPGDWPILKNSQIKGDKIYQVLKEKMKKVPDDTWNPHQGEAMMMSLFAAIASEKRLADIRGQGMFRKGANLAVIFVTDENDVCYQYPKPLSEYTVRDDAAFLAGEAPVLKTYPTGKSKSVTSADRLEIEAQKLCTIKGKETSKYINWQAVEEKLRSLEASVLNEGSAAGATQKRAKVIVSSIAYLSNNGPQMKALTDNEDENEMGHGVLELVDAFSGQKADMKIARQSGSFAEVLELIGNTTNFMSKHDVSYICQPGLVDGKRLNGEAIDYSTVELEVIQAPQAEIDSFNPDRPNLTPYGQNLARYSAKCPKTGACQSGNGGLKVESFAGGKTIRVTPSDVAGYQRVMNNYRAEGAKYRITYRTKKDVNPFLEGSTAPVVSTGYKAPVRPASSQVNGGGNGKQPQITLPAYAQKPQPNAQPVNPAAGHSVPGDRPQTVQSRPTATPNSRQVVRPGQEISGPEAAAKRAEAARRAKEAQTAKPQTAEKPTVQPEKPSQPVTKTEPRVIPPTPKSEFPIVNPDQVNPADIKPVKNDVKPAKKDAKPAKKPKPAGKKA